MKKFIMPSVFFAVAFLYYGILNPQWCNYHEQYQLFMFGWEYLAGHLAIASGMADYVAEFVVQFFYIPVLGAALWAAVLAGMGALVNAVSELLCKTHNGIRAVGYLVPALFMIYQADINAMLAFPVSVLMALLAVWAYARVDCGWRVWLNVVAVPALYWLAGYGALVYIPLAIMLEGRRGEWSAARMAAFISGMCLLYVVTALAASRTAMLQYPMIDIMCGVNFYRNRLEIPLMQHIVALATVGVILFAGRASFAEKAWGRRFAAFASIMVVQYLCCWFFTNKRMAQSLYIDYLVRNEQWESIIGFFEKHPVTNEYECTGLNLALAKMGQLSERQFQFNQFGLEGMISTFKRDMVSCTITAEVCYHLGLVNSVLRYNFDSQEAIINCNRSGRFTKRIAEAFLINGNYEVASKYTDMLSRTIFYRSFSDACVACFANPMLINRNRKWAQLARCRIKANTVFSNTEMSNFLLTLYQQAPDNRIALDYALAVDLVKGDMEHFLETFPLTQGGRDTGFGYVPRVYQEALSFVLFQRSGNVANMPYFISPEVRQDLQEFARRLMMNPNDEQLSQGRLSKTFWKYVAN